MSVRGLYKGEATLVAPDERRWTVRASIGSHRGRWYGTVYTDPPHEEFPVIELGGLTLRLELPSGEVGEVDIDSRGSTFGTDIERKGPPLPEF